MSGDYLDASLILATLIDESGSSAANAYFRAVDSPLLVSEFASAEVAAAFSRLTRSGEIAVDAALRRLDQYDVWLASAAQPVDIDASDVRVAHRFVRRFDLMLRAPDALHVAVAQRLSARLATMDRRLALAAQALGVEVRLITADADAAQFFRQRAGEAKPEDLNGPLDEASDGAPANGDERA